MWTVPWPSGIHETLIWSEYILLWVTVNYALAADPADKETLQEELQHLERRGSRVSRLYLRIVGRSVLGGLVVFLLPGWSTSDVPVRISIAFGMFMLFLALPYGRSRLAGSRSGHNWLAEWELAVNLLLIVGTAFAVGTAELRVSAPLLRLPLTDGQLAAVCVSLSGLIFAIRGGTHVVRGILDKTETFPLIDAGRPTTDGPGRAADSAEADANPIDIPEYARGRTIGNIERILLLFVVAIGSYEALGFLIAAKGLIRTREFHNRNFAEYFIIGSLASVLVALLIGIILQVTVPLLWVS